MGQTLFPLYNARMNSFSPSPALSQGASCVHTLSAKQRRKPSTPSPPGRGGGCSLARYQVQRPPTTKARRKTGPSDGQDVLGISLELTLPGLMKTHELSFWTSHQLSVASAVSRGCASDHAQLSLACSPLQVPDPLWFKEGESRKEGMERESHTS